MTETANTPEATMTQISESDRTDAYLTICNLIATSDSQGFDVLMGALLHLSGPAVGGPITEAERRKALEDANDLFSASTEGMWSPGTVGHDWTRRVARRLRQKGVR